MSASVERRDEELARQEIDADRRSERRLWGKALLGLLVVAALVAVREFVLH